MGGTADYMKKFLITVLVLSLIAATGCNDTTLAPRQPLVHDFEEITDRYGLADVYEDDRFLMQIDFDEFRISVLDKDSSVTWLSNPENIDSDPVANYDYAELMRAQVSFTYLNNRSRQTMDSYRDCILKEQYKVFRIENGIRVEYTFGDQSFTVLDIPKMISAVRMESFLDKLDEASRADVEACYEKDEATGVYSYKQNVFGLKAAAGAEGFRKAGYTYEDLVADSKEFDLPVETTEKMTFMIPVEYTVGDSLFKARIPVPEIVYDERTPILDISLLEFFGAALSDDGGYIFIPDGCGALIDMDQDVHDYYQLSLPVYSYNKGTGMSVISETRQPVSFPVFGLKSGDKAFFAEIEEGDAIADINATRANTNSSYNTASSSYTINFTDTVSLGNPDSPTAILAPQYLPYAGDIAVSYKFLYGDKADYQGMADYYRNTLTERGNVRSGTINYDSGYPFFLEVIGAVDTVKQFLGIQYRSVSALTTFDQAAEIVTAHEKAGIDDIKLIFNGWFNNGFYQDYPSKIKTVKSLGGIGDMLSLYSKTEMYPVVRLLTFRENDGFSVFRHAARTIDQQTARLYKLNRSSGSMDRAGFIITPFMADLAADEIIRFNEANAIERLCADDAGVQIYPDYGKKNFTDMQDSMDVNIAIVNKLAGRSELILRGATAGTSAAASAVIEAPLYSSGYLISNRDVPFYQMVYHGMFHYSGEIMNQSADVSKDYMRSVLFGASLHYVETYTDFSALAEAEFYEFNSTYFRDNLEQAAQLYIHARTILADLYDKQMIDYVDHGNEVYSVLYDNGTAVYVNYGDEDHITENNNVIKAGSMGKEVIKK